jgi:hypothetical protein
VTQAGSLHRPALPRPPGRDGRGRGSRLAPDMRAQVSHGWIMAGPGAEPENPGVEEDLAMSERKLAPGSSGDEPGKDSDVLDEAREVALLREVLRTQEQHREGGIEPELDSPGLDRGPGR